MHLIFYFGYILDCSLLPFYRLYLIGQQTSFLVSPWVANGWFPKSWTAVCLEVDIGFFLTQVDYRVWVWIKPHVTRMEWMIIIYDMYSSSGFIPDFNWFLILSFRPSCFGNALLESDQRLQPDSRPISFWFGLWLAWLGLGLWSKVLY